MDELFEHSSIKRAYFTLALPVVLSMAVTLIYNMVDTFFVAKTGNPNFYVNDCSWGYLWSWR